MTCRFVCWVLTALTAENIDGDDQNEKDRFVIENNMTCGIFKLYLLCIWYADFVGRLCVRVG